MSGVYALKILLVEQDPLVMKALTQRLSVKGYEIFSLTEPHEAPKKISQIQPHLLIFSLAFPDPDLFGVLEGIRALPKKELANIPIIIGSKTGDIIEIGRALRLNIKDYFVYSSFNPDQVVEKIEHQLSRLAASQAPSVSEEILQSKLLIVEDDKFLRDLASQKLAREHMNVLVAVDGEQGVALAEKEKPAVILLDILLPGIDGYEVLRRVRANPELKSTKVVMLSNFGQREDIEKALSMGADQYLIKANFTLDEIVEEIKKILVKQP